MRHNTRRETQQRAREENKQIKRMDKRSERMARRKSMQENFDTWKETTVNNLHDKTGERKRQN